MIDLEKIAYDIGVGKSNDLTRWMLPIATLEEMIALIRKQEAALAAPAAPVVTVDSIESKFGKFWSLMGAWGNANPGEDADIKANEIVKYIDAHTAEAVAQARAAALAELHPAYEAMQMRVIDAEAKLAAAPQQHTQAADCSRVTGNAQAALSDEVIDHMWKMYQQGQGSADHTAKEVFTQTLQSLAEWLTRQQPVAASMADEVTQAHALLSTLCVGETKNGKPASLLERITELYQWYYALTQPESAPVAAAAPQGSLLKAIRDGVPLEEPVSVCKAMMAHMPARVVLDKGVGPLAAVHLVNIGVGGWVHTKETATAYANGFNRGAEWLRSSIIEYADSQPPAEAALGDAKDKRIRFLEKLVDAYGPKSYQYDIEHPNDGLNATQPSPAQAEPLSQPAAAGNAGAVELPPLPECWSAGSYRTDFAVYTADQMEQYGFRCHQQGRAAGLDEAAKELQRLYPGWDGTIAAIRALNKGG